MSQRISAKSQGSWRKGWRFHLGTLQVLGGPCRRQTSSSQTLGSHSPSTNTQNQPSLQQQQGACIVTKAKGSPHLPYRVERMGVQISKTFSSRLRSEDILEILRDSEVVDQLRQAYSSIGRAQRDQLRTIVQGRYVQHWNLAPSDIDRSRQFWYQPLEGSGLSLPRSPTSCYQLSKDLQAQIEYRRTLWRGFLTFYAHVLRKWCNGVSPQTTLFAVVSALYHFNLGEDEARDIQRWAIEGERLLRVSDELQCQGWFLLLPEGITQVIPSSGEGFKEAVELLREHRICDLAKSCGADSFVDSLHQALWAALNIDASKQNQPQRSLSASSQLKSFTFLNTLQRPSDLDFLSLFLLSLGGSKIDERILEQAVDRQSRWASDGSTRNVSVRDVGLLPEIERSFVSRKDLYSNLSALMNNGILIKENERGISRYSVMKSADVLEWGGSQFRVQGLLFAAYIFPRDELLHASFRDLGRRILPYFRNAWHYARETSDGLSADQREEVADAMLSVSRFVAPTKVDDTIDTAARVSDSDHVRLAVALRKSISLRCKGSFGRSRDVIRDSLGVDPLLYKQATKCVTCRCYHGRLILSQTENAMQQMRYDEADALLSVWTIESAEASLRELSVARFKGTVAGRLLRYRGDFSQALSFLRNTLDKALINSDNRLHVKYHIADIYCELGAYDDAVELVQPEITKLELSDRQRSKEYRRMCLPLLEAHLLLQRYEDVRTTLQYLYDTFDNLRSPDLTDQLGYVRLLLLHTRLAFAEGQWVEVLRISDMALRKADQGSWRGYYDGIIYRFRALAFQKCQYMALQSAQQCDQKLRHFIPGMGTYVLQELIEAESGTRRV